MRKWHFYDSSTGRFTGRTLITSDADLVVDNTLPGHSVYATPPDEKIDPRCQRIDTATGDLVDYQPPAPPDDALRTWAWSDKDRRWVSAPTAAALKAQRNAPIMAALDALDAKQARPVREMLLALMAGTALPADAKQRMSELDDQAAALRARLE